MPTFNDIQFLYPDWWWLLPVIYLLLIVVLRTQKFSLQPPSIYSLFASGARYRHPAIDLLRELATSTAVKTRKLKQLKALVFYAGLLFLITAALAQPYRLGQQLPEPPRYRDIMFIVDTSISMLLRDYVVAGRRVERMAMTRSVLSHFIKQLEGNRIGIVAFSEKAYTVVPLTTDYNLLQTQLARLDSATLTGRTNNLSHGLLYTSKQLAQTELLDDENKPVLVLLTNANRPTRDIDPLVVANYLRQQGYRLHTVAIGSPGYQAAEKNAFSLIYHPTNFKLLKDVAAAAGGKFYWAKNTDNLQETIQVIQQAERREVKVEARYIQIPLYQWPVLAGIVWIMLWQLASLVKLIVMNTRVVRS